MMIDFPVDTREIGSLDRHLVVDHLEILLLANKRDEISKSDLDDLLRDSSVYDENSISRLEWLRNDDRYAAAEGKEAKHELFLDIIWECVTSRPSLFGATTPFRIEDNVLRLDPARREACRDYLLMLLCSKLRMVPAEKRVALAAEFEDLCLRYMQQRLFPSADVRRFSRGGGFPTKLREAIPALSDWLRERVREDELSQLSDNGDYGLDLVGLLNSDPYASGSVFLLAQCAAREHDWQKKRDEARHILAVLDPYCDPTILLFIPHAYRSASGDWLVKADARSVALFDRLRLLGGADAMPAMAASAA